MPGNEEYADFDISIESLGGSLTAKVIDSPAGPSNRETLPPLVKGIPMSELLLKLENAVLRASEHADRRSSPEAWVLRDFGGSAFDSVFRESDDIRTKFQQSLDRVREDRTLKGLRLKFRLPPELSQLPWEYLYDRRKRDFLCLLESSPLVRFLEDSNDEEEPVVDGPLRVLGLIANPQGPWPSLDVARERRVIDKAMGKLQRDGRAEFRWAEADTEEHLLDIMGREDWHVFHFIGHGGAQVTPEYGEGTASRSHGPPEGFIVLLDENRKPVEVPASRLKLYLRRSPSLRLVVLNCCESARGNERDPYASPAAALMRAEIPAVVAMQYPIGDGAAITFAQHFYRALSDNQSVERALTGARLGMHIKSDVEWGIPVLFSRSRTSRLFNFRAPSEPHCAVAGEHKPGTVSAQESALAELRALFNSPPGGA